MLIALASVLPISSNEGAANGVLLESPRSACSLPLSLFLLALMITLMALKRKRQRGPEPTAAEGGPEPIVADLFSLCRCTGTAVARPFSYIRSLHSHSYHLD